MRRAISPAILAARQASDLTAPFLANMPKWQRRTAYIDAALTTRAVAAAEQQLLVRECDAIAAEIGLAVTGLDKAAWRTPPHIAGHSRVDDVRRALAAMLARLERIAPADGISRRATDRQVRTQPVPGLDVPAPISGRRSLDRRQPYRHAPEG